MMPPSHTFRDIQRFAYGPVAVRAFDLLKKRRIYPTYRWLMDTQWLSPDDLHALQLSQLTRVLDHAWNFSPFYRDRLAALGWSPADGASDEVLDRLPVLEKEELQLNFDRIATISRWTGGRPVLWSTGGSTGVPTRIYVDTHTRDRRQAVQFRNASWLGVRPGDPIAIIGGTSLGISRAASPRQRLNAASKRRLFLPAWELDDRALDSHADRLERFRPRVLIGYGGAIHALAEYLVRSGRRVTLPGVISTGEMLLDQWRPTIEEAFGCSVYDRYGSIEVGDIAHGCSACGAMHVNDENIMLQVDPHNGDLLVTDLTTFATPMIKYRIGDRVTLRRSLSSCKRGLSEIVQIEGRSSDVIHLPGGRSLSGMVFSFTPGDTPGVKQYQVWQPASERLQVIVTCEGRFPYRQILDELRPVLPEVAIEVHRVHALELAASGKRQTIVKGKAFTGDTIEFASSIDSDPYRHGVPQ